MTCQDCTTGFAGLPGIPAYNLQQLALLKWLSGTGATGSNITLSFGLDYPNTMCYDQSLLWVGCTGTPGAIYSVTPNTVTSTQWFAPFDLNYDMCYDGLNVWVSTTGLIGFNPSTPASKSPVLTGFTGLGICCGGQSIWQANNISGSVSQYTLTGATGSFTQSITVGTNPVKPCFDGNYVWVTNNGSSNVSQITLAGVVNGTYTTGAGSHPYWACTDQISLWITDNLAGNVIQFNLNTYTYSTIAVGTTPMGCCFDGYYVWVANYGSGTVSQINTITSTVVNTYNVGGNRPMFLSMGLISGSRTLVMVY